MTAHVCLVQSQCSNVHSLQSAIIHLERESMILQNKPSHKVECVLSIWDLACVTYKRSSVSCLVHHRLDYPFWEEKNCHPVLWKFSQLMSNVNLCLTEEKKMWQLHLIQLIPVLASKVIKQSSVPVPPLPKWTLSSGFYNPYFNAASLVSLLSPELKCPHWDRSHAPLLKSVSTRVFLPSLHFSCLFL